MSRGGTWPPAGPVTGPCRIRSTRAVEDAVELARSRLPRGESLLQCEECGAEIPAGRREALPGVRLCVGCQSERDRHDAPHAGYNRRGSKDSQLR